MARKQVTNPQKLPQPKGHYVYCYLRTDSNLPYYVGLGSRPDRMTAAHTCNVPSDRSRIRVMREGLTRKQADRWEIFYINHFGRKSDGGCLVNMREGGEGGAHNEETNQRIAAKVAQHHENGVYSNLNAALTIQRRAAARMTNKAAEFGIPADAYAAMTKNERGQAKEWLSENASCTYADWLATRKSSVAAAKYGLSEAEWLGLSKKQRNGLKEWMNRFSGRNPYDYIAGKREVGGSKSRIDKALVISLVSGGMTQSAVAVQLGCNQSTIGRIVNGKRQRLN